MFLVYIDIKNNYLKNKKIYFNIFINKKYFKQFLLPQSQIVT